MRKLLLPLVLLLAGCQMMSTDTTNPADMQHEVVLDWQVTGEEPGPYDEPRTSLALIVTGAVEEAVDLGTYSGSFADGRELSVEDTTGAILKGILWWAGAGDELIVLRPRPDTLTVSHREVDEQGTAQTFTVIHTISIPADAVVSLAPWRDQ